MAALSFWMPVRAWNAEPPVAPKKKLATDALTSVALREPGEPKESAPVACPHCWATIHVEIGTWAVVGGDYSADKL